MKRIFSILFALVLVLSLGLVMAVPTNVNANAFILDQQQTIQTSWSNIGPEVSGGFNEIGAQSFTPAYSTQCYVQLYVRKVGSPDVDLVCEIREDDGTGKPDMAATALLATASVSSVTASFGWVIFDFDDFDATVGDTYWIVLSTPGITADGDHYDWANNPNNPYNAGHYGKYTQGGWFDWHPNHIVDAVFKTFVTEAPPIIEVEIDIKPDSDPNSINLGDHGVLPVAILGSEDFDVYTIDASTIQIGAVSLASRGSAKAPKLAYSYEDVNEDGYMDLVAFFRVQALVTEGVLTDMTAELVLTAETSGGMPIEGKDSVRIVPPE